MTRRHLLWALLPAACLAAGCLAPARPVPVLDGIPVRRLPEEVLGRPKAELNPVPLTLLRRTGEYRLDAGDVLGVYVGEVLGGGKEPVPVHVNPDPNAPRAGSPGYPVTVQGDGTILLPDLPPVNVRGKTLAEVRDIVIGMVTGDIFLPGSKRMIVPGRERVLVDLIEPRRVRVLVVREDLGPQAVVAGPCEPAPGCCKKGAGFTVHLPANQNDLLEALNRTGGPPGPDAKNEVIIRRGQFDPADPCRGFVRVPLRARPDEPLTFTEADIILNDGDTVYIESRDAEAYYTAGLLDSAQVPLPRDHDVRVIEAIALVHGPLAPAGAGQLVTVVRRLPTQREIRIRVDLAEAFRDPRENILVQPGDILVLQEKPCGPRVRCWLPACHLPHLHGLALPTPQPAPCDDP